VSELIKLHLIRINEHYCFISVQSEIINGWKSQLEESWNILREEIEIQPEVEWMVDHILAEETKRREIAEANQTNPWHHELRQTS